MYSRIAIIIGIYICMYVYIYIFTYYIVTTSNMYICLYIYIYILVFRYTNWYFRLPPARFSIRKPVHFAMSKGHMMNHDDRGYGAAKQK